MRLNLGCGDRYADGWHNVDFGYPYRVDERLDLEGVTTALPWSGVTHVYAGHLLEHLPQATCAHLAQLLLDCADPAGCLLMVVGPDVPVARRMIAEGTFDGRYHSLESIVRGGHRWPGDDHKWETSGPLVAELVRQASWPVVTDLGGVRFVDAFWPVADREPQWQYAVRAWVGDDPARPW